MIRKTHRVIIAAIALVMTFIIIPIMSDDVGRRDYEVISMDSTFVAEEAALNLEKMECISEFASDAICNIPAEEILITENYTEDEIFYIAAAVCREVGDASDEIQMLVANVIINRVNSPIYPDTVYDVLTQYKQYGTMWKHGISFPDWADESVKNRCYDVARRILRGERVCPDNVLFQAEFIQGSGVYKEIDGIYFCYYE